MAKKYRLKKDIPGISAGSELSWSKMTGGYRQFSDGHFASGKNYEDDMHNTIPKYLVENNPDWFEEVKEETPAERIAITHFKGHDSLRGHSSAHWYQFCSTKQIDVLRNKGEIQQAIEQVVNGDFVWSDDLAYEFHGWKLDNPSGKMDSFKASKSSSKPVVQYQKPSEDSYEFEKGDRVNIYDNVEAKEDPRAVYNPGFDDGRDSATKCKNCGRPGSEHQYPKFKCPTPLIAPVSSGSGKSEDTFLQYLIERKEQFVEANDYETAANWRLVERLYTLYKESSNKNHYVSLEESVKMYMENSETWNTTPGMKVEAPLQTVSDSGSGKDWEIVGYKKFGDVKSIRRISDGDITSIGDEICFPEYPDSECKYRKIDRFEFFGDTVIAYHKCYGKIFPFWDKPTIDTAPNKTYSQEENKDTVIIGQAKEIVRLNEIIKDQVMIITSLKTRLEYNL